MILDFLVEKYGWKELAGKIKINCFIKDPSVKSSLKFLRKTPWAREKVEKLYLNSVKKMPKFDTGEKYYAKQKEEENNIQAPENE